MNQRVGGDFFSVRLQVSPPQEMVSTVTYTSRECPVCNRFARVLVRPPQSELQGEICVDFCDGDKKYPAAYVSFKGNFIQDGHMIVETLRGQDGKSPSREELKGLIKEVLFENSFWKRLFRIKEKS